MDQRLDHARHGLADRHNGLLAHLGSARAMADRVHDASARRHIRANLCCTRSCLAYFFKLRHHSLPACFSAVDRFPRHLHSWLAALPRALVVASLGQHASPRWPRCTFNHQAHPIFRASRSIAPHSICSNGRALSWLSAINGSMGQCDFLGTCDSHRRQFIPAPLARFRS